MADRDPVHMEQLCPRVLKQRTICRRLVTTISRGSIVYPLSMPMCCIHWSLNRIISDV